VIRVETILGDGRTPEEVHPDLPYGAIKEDLGATPIGCTERALDAKNYSSNTQQGRSPSRSPYMLQDNGAEVRPSAVRPRRRKHLHSATTSYTSTTSRLGWKDRLEKTNFLRERDPHPHFATKHHNIIGDGKFSIVIYHHFFLMHETGVYDSTPFECDGRTKT